jgi:hypothetical protein
MIVAKSGRFLSYFPRAKAKSVVNQMSKLISSSTKIKSRSSPIG